MNNDKRITITSMFKNNNIYNFSVKFSPDGVYDIYFSLARMVAKNGTPFWMWPQTIHNQELANETNYKKGVNKHIFGNKAFGVAVQEACQEHLDKEEGNDSHDPIMDAAKAYVNQPNKSFGQAEEVNGKDINLEEIKF